MPSTLRILCAVATLGVGVAPPAHALDGRELLGASAKMSDAAGWSDRRAFVTIEMFDEGKDEREQRVETKESLGEDLKVSTLTEFLAPSKVRGVHVLDLWSATTVGDSWVWSPTSSLFQKIPRDPVDPSYRDAQLLDLLPRMSELVDVRVVDDPESEPEQAPEAAPQAPAEKTETADAGAPARDDAVVLDVDVGERRWPLGRHFRVWIGPDDGRIRRIETRSPDGEVSRVVTALAYADADGRPTATKVSIENPKSKRRVVFVRSEIEYDRGLPPETFQVPDRPVSPPST